MVIKVNSHNWMLDMTYIESDRSSSEEDVIVDHTQDSVLPMYDDTWNMRNSLDIFPKSEYLLDDLTNNDTKEMQNTCQNYNIVNYQMSNNIQKNVLLNNAKKIVNSPHKKKCNVKECKRVSKSSDFSDVSKNKCRSQSWSHSLAESVISANLITKRSSSFNSCISKNKSVFYKPKANFKYKYKQFHEFGSNNDVSHQVLWQKSVSTPSICGDEKESFLTISHEESDSETEKNDMSHNTSFSKILPHFVKNDYLVTRNQTSLFENLGKRSKKGNSFFRKTKFFQEKNAKGVLKYPLDNNSFKQEKNTNKILSKHLSLVSSTSGSAKSSFHISNSFISPSSQSASLPCRFFHDDVINVDESTICGPDNVPLLAVAFQPRDPELGLLDEEPESWSKKIDKEVSLLIFLVHVCFKIVKNMSELDVKRQEHIYEFIITEKHHCLTLQVMQKLFAEGLKKQLGYSSDLIDKLFPGLDDLLKLHCDFLLKLRRRQREGAVISTISDILFERFSGNYGEEMKLCYGRFCSRHKDSLIQYKDLGKQDRNLMNLVRQWSFHPLCKKKGIPECILFVTQRITKYPLLIEPLIKTARSLPHDKEILTKALSLVKNILVNVNAQVAEKEREERLHEIYNKIDGKTYTWFKNKKFKKCDILKYGRSLRFEGNGTLIVLRSKPVEVTIVVLTDILFFLTEANQKYIFFTPEHKAGVISLKKILIREKAGQEQPSFYLISTGNQVPEMYEINCMTPRDRKFWISAIRHAIEQYSQTEGMNVQNDELDESVEEHYLKNAIEQLQQQDDTLAAICKEKILLLFSLLRSQGYSIEQLSSFLPSDPNYTNLISGNLKKAHCQFSHLLQEANKFVQYIITCEAKLNRSASSVGEMKSESFESAILPRRAETFNGFDANKKASPLPPLPVTDSTSLPLITASLSHAFNNVLCFLSQYFTLLERFRLESVESWSTGGRFQYQYNHQLEELRNLQDKLTIDRENWCKERDLQEEEIRCKRNELIQLQEQLKKEQLDIQQQRETLYRKLEALKNQGFVLSSNLTLVAAPNIVEEQHRPITKKHPNVVNLTKNNEGLPINLISAKNQIRGQQVQVKQQLPMKLAKAGNHSISEEVSHSSLSPLNNDMQQQLLPFKLSESSNEKNSKGLFNYQKFGSYNSLTSVSNSYSNSGSSPSKLLKPQNLISNSKSPAQLQPSSYSDSETNQKIVFI